MRSMTPRAVPLSLVVAAISLSACTNAPVPEPIASSDKAPAQANTGVSLAGGTPPIQLSCRDALLATHSRPSDDTIWSYFTIDVDDPRLDLDVDRPVHISATSIERPGRCLIKLGDREVMSPQPRRVLSNRSLRSSYPAGTKRAPNPDYVEAKQKTGDEGFTLGPFLKTGDPTVDLIGVLTEGVVAGFNAFSAADDEPAAASSPKTIQVDRLVPYSYKLSELEARRSGRLSIALHDRTLGSWHPITIDLEEQKLIALSDDRHPNDEHVQHDPHGTLMTSVQLDRWEKSFPVIRVSTLFNHLHQSVRTKPEKQLQLAVRKADDIVIEPAAGKPVGFEPPPTDRSINASPLALAEAIWLSDGNDAAGFYVHEQHVVVPTGSLPSTSLVPLRYPDGKLVYGLLEHTDNDLGLAVVFTPRLGTPHALTTTSFDVGPDTGVVAGLPLLSEGDVVGVWADLESGDRRFIQAPAIAQLTQAARLD